MYSFAGIMEQSTRQLNISNNTNAGELLYNYSKKILLLVDQAESSIKDIANMKKGRLLVGASTTIGIYLLPRIVGDFTKRYL